jgi:hypothetical protein
MPPRCRAGWWQPHTTIGTSLLVAQQVELAELAAEAMVEEMVE